ncbi:hypothetical protein JCM1840_001401 [Sporobolomyces johnsonii]
MQPITVEAMRHWPISGATSRYDDYGLDRTLDSVMDEPKLVAFWHKCVDEIVTAYKQIWDFMFKLRLNRDPFWARIKPPITHVPDLVDIMSITSLENILGILEKKGLGVTQGLWKHALACILARGEQKKENEDNNDQEQEDEAGMSAVIKSLTRADCF